METGYLFRYGSEDDPNFKCKVATFEKEFAQYSDAKHCVAVTSGTGALLCCLAALGIGPGDEVIVPGYTFIASISTIALSKAIPVLAEIDKSLTIDPEDIRKKITKRTKAIMPVHIRVIWTGTWRLQGKIIYMCLKIAARPSEQLTRVKR